MGGHIDDGEEDLTKPIVSISFGNTVVFLMGGETREVQPTAVYIKSGDIVIMSGESRKWYHGVPRMLEFTGPDFFKDTEGEEFVYMQNARINVNARQVKIKRHDE